MTEQRMDTDRGRNRAVPGPSKSGFAPGWAKDVAVDVALPVAAVALALAVYHWWVVATDQPAYRFPTPEAVWRQLADNPGFFARQAWVTGYEAMFGLILACGVAVALGALMASNSLVERTVLPIAVLVKVTPVVAIAPALIIWWGFGLWPKVAVAALLTFFPLLINSVTGFRSVSREVGWLMDVYRVPWWRRFALVRLPAAAPYLLSGIKVSGTLAIVGAVVAEWFGADRGLGRVIYLASVDIQPARLFAAVAVLAAMGILFTVIVGLAERWLLGWHESRILEG